MERGKLWPKAAMVGLRGFSSFSLFAGWVAGMNANMRFLGKSANMTVLCRALWKKRLEGAAPVLEVTVLPNLAEWR